MEEKRWVCVRQRAGPLTKEVRYIRPAVRVSDLPSVRKEKNRIVRLIRDSCFRRTSTDRLELMLALMGWDATVYVLTFSEDQLPETFNAVRRRWAQFIRCLRKQRGEAMDYIYVIEGLHGDKRWHIHAVFRDADVSLKDVERWWSGGIVMDPEPLLQGPWDKPRRTAEYFTKERRDGVRFPKGVRQWVAAPSLYRQLDPPEKKQVRTGAIRMPQGTRELFNKTEINAFGAFHYRIWLKMP